MSGNTENNTFPKEPITLIGEKVPAGTEKEFTFRLGSAATIRNISVYNYEGEGFDLKYFVKIKSDGRSNALFDNFGDEDNYIAGNDSQVNWDMRTTVNKDDEIHVRIVNEDQNNDYVTNLQIEVDYETGLLNKLGL